MADEPVKPADEAEEGEGPQKKLQPRRRRSSTPSLPDADTAKGAGAAGVGGGTLVAIIASSLPDGAAKTVLIWLAPTLAITLSALWIWCRRKIQEYYEHRQAEAAFRAARNAIDVALSNDSLTPEQRKAFEIEKVKLDQMIVERRMTGATRHVRKT